MTGARSPGPAPRGAATALAGLLLAGAAGAHDGVVHATPEEAARHRAQTGDAPPVLVDPAPPSGPVTALPFDLGGPFELVDQHGATRTEADPDGRLQLLFFGYANCPSICAVAMPMMAEVADLLADRGVPVTPVMITVDPERDTVETMDAPLAELHPDFVGLTGEPEVLEAAWAAFGIERELVMELPDLGPVYSHGGHVFLLDAAGEVLTILPPVLSVGAMSDIAARYAEPEAG